jgi:hypothetical protein
MTPADLQAGIAALQAALASGELRVSYAGRTIEYRSVAELSRAIDLLRAELDRAASGPVSRITYVRPAS